jgi:hypothetical protein
VHHVDFSWRQNGDGDWVIYKVTLVCVNGCRVLVVI